MSRLQKHPAKSYIDYAAYLNSEDDNIINFVNHKGKCKVVLSCINDERTIEEYTKNGYLLKWIERFGQEYAVVLTEENIMSVPKSKIVF